MQKSSTENRRVNAENRKALGMQTASSKEQFVAGSLAFFRMCICPTPLRRYSDVFDPPGRSSGNQVLKDCLLDGLVHFRSDLARWNFDFKSPEDLFEQLLLAPNLQATYFYRVSHALHLRKVKLIPDVIATLSRILTGTEIYYSAEIGPGLKVIHGVGTVIAAKCKIGSYFTVYQNVTIGDKLGKETGTDKRPVIDDYVIVSAGAQVLGPVSIGAKTIIGANAVVIRPLPGHCIAAGIPAEIKARNISEEKFFEFWNSIKQ